MVTLVAIASDVIYNLGNKQLITTDNIFLSINFSICFGFVLTRTISLRIKKINFYLHTLIKRPKLIGNLNKVTLSYSYMTSHSYFGNGMYGVHSSVAYVSKILVFSHSNAISSF